MSAAIVESVAGAVTPRDNYEGGHWDMEASKLNETAPDRPPRKPVDLPPRRDPNVEPDPKPLDDPSLLPDPKPLDDPRPGKPRKTMMLPVDVEVERLLALR
jgi:hypothetical protein